MKLLQKTPKCVLKLYILKPRKFRWFVFCEGCEGRGGPNPISQEIVFFKSQLKSHNPSLYCSNWNPIPILLLFFFINPSPSAQNPISKPLKKANPSSHFTPSRPSSVDLDNETFSQHHFHDKFSTI